MFTNSPLHFSQHPFIKPAELFLYVFLIIASERSRMVYLTFWCPSGNNAINHLWPLLFQADICCRVTHWLSRLGLLPFPTQIDRQTDTHTHRHIHTDTHTHTHTLSPSGGDRNWNWKKGSGIPASWDYVASLQPVCEPNQPHPCGHFPFF